MSAPTQIPTATVEEITRTLQVLHRTGDLFEIRAPKTRTWGTLSGYFTDPATAARHIVGKYDGKVPWIYTTLNTVDPTAQGRAANRLQTHTPEGSTTKDKEIRRLLWILLDFDPERLSGISSTEEEHQAALERAGFVFEYITGPLGLPEPVRADSANGAHLLLPIDLPNDKDSLALVKRVLAAIDGTFTDSAVHLDTGVGNPSRITKVYGTMVCKGDNVPDRPHRRSHLLSVPDEIIPATIEQLEYLCSELGFATTTSDFPRRTSSSSADRAASPLHIADAGEYLAQHGIEVAREKRDGSAVIYALKRCPFSEEHTDGAFVVQRQDGSITAKCHHNSCQGKGLADLRDAVEPGWRNQNGGSLRTTTSNSLYREITSTSTEQAAISDVRSREIPLVGANGQNHADDRFTSGHNNATSDTSGLLRRDPNTGRFPVLSANDLESLGISKPEMLVTGKILKRTLAMIYGNGKTGKSYYVQHLCFELASVGVPVWYIAAEGFDGMYLRMVAWKAKDSKRKLDALRVIPMPVQLFQQHGRDAAILAAQAHDMPLDLRPEVIVVDTIHRCTSGARENDNGDMACVAGAALLWRQEAQAATIGVHHEGKNAGQGMRGASCLYDDPDTVMYIFRGGDISVVECEAQRDGMELFEPEAFTLETCSLDMHGYPGLGAKVIKPLESNQVIEARQIWEAERSRRQNGKNAAGDEEDAAPLSGKRQKAFDILNELHKASPDIGVSKQDWRAACEKAGIKQGSLNWLIKDLEKSGKVERPDTTGRYHPCE